MTGLTTLDDGPAKGPFRGTRFAILVVLGASLATTACTRLSGLGQSDLPARQNAATPLQPTPLTPVREAELAPATPTPPAPPVNATELPETPETPDAETPPVQVANAGPPPDAQPVTRQALIGAWTVSTGGTNCQIFLALTKWSGGFRAASRGCSAASISDVQAWDVKGKQVVLVDSSGGTAATLFKSTDSRYDGSTSGGGAISFSR